MAANDPIVSYRQGGRVRDRVGVRLRVRLRVRVYFRVKVRFRVSG